MSYCSADDVKDSLDIQGAKYNKEISQYIKVAADWIDQYCMYYGVDRPFEIPADSTRYYDNCAVDGLLLRTDVPFVGITSITNGDGSALASSAYRLQPRNHPRFYEVHLLTNFKWQFNDADSEIVVVGKFGYSEVVPRPVAEACSHLSGWLFQRWQAGLNTSSATTELGTVRQVTDVPAHVKTLLETYVERSKML